VTTRSLAILGSTGSIGTQAVELLLRQPDAFSVVGLAAGGGRVDALARQVNLLHPSLVAVHDGAAALALDRALGGTGVPILVGAAGVEEVAGCGADVVLNAITGSVGLGSTLRALSAGSTLALANKESLVAGGRLVRAAVQREGQIVPVDSEHSAIAQCLRAGSREEVSRLILTASGGPFRGWSREDLARVTPEQALAHPTWSMGPVVTVNSSTLVNKALELAEAHYLFDVPAEAIDVIVHPQSYVHSMVEFVDGATICQVSPPDMRLPIAWGLAWPDRLEGAVEAARFDRASAWEFEPLDESVFPAVRLMREALATSWLHPAVLNAANEVCVEAFLAGRLGYLGIVETVERVLDVFCASGDEDLQVLAQAEEWARAAAADVLERGRCQP